MRRSLSISTEKIQKAKTKCVRFLIVCLIAAAMFMHQPLTVYAENSGEVISQAARCGGYDKNSSPDSKKRANAVSTLIVFAIVALGIAAIRKFALTQKENTADRQLQETVPGRNSFAPSGWKEVEVMATGKGLIELDIDKMSENKARILAIGILENRKSNSLSGAAACLGCSILFVLLEILIFHEAGGMSEGALEGGATSISESFHYSRMLRQLKKGTYKKSAVDCLKLFQAEESRDAIWKYASEREKAHTDDYTAILKYINCYQAYVKENPDFRLKTVDKSIDTIQTRYEENQKKSSKGWKEGLKK